MIPQKELEETLDQAKVKANAGDKEAQYRVAMYYLKRKNENHYYKTYFVEYIEKSVAQGYCEAQREYANFLSADLSRTGDEALVRAAELYYKAALSKDAFSVNMLQEKGEFYKKLKAISEQNNYYYNSQDSVQVKSAYLLAKLHYDDAFSQRNTLKSIEYYVKAAKHNHILACNELGDIYYYGRGIEKNYQEAFKWFKQVCDSRYGNSYSYYSLAIMYHNGQGITKNIDEAISLYEKALEKGHSDASTQLGHIYRDKAAEARKATGSNATYYAGNYTAKAIQYYKRNENDKNVQNYMGLVYYASGDYDNAKQWFEKASKQGLLVAQHNVALTFENGFKDIKNAISWYEFAAKNGSADAQHALALKYEKGEGVCKDEIRAFSWCLKAAENNNEAAKALLKKEDSFFYRYNKLYTEMNAQGIDDFKNNLEQFKKYIDFEKRLVYEFSDPTNLFDALDRRQDTGDDENKGTQEAYFQPYEFLGDGVLSAVVRQYILDNKPSYMKVGQMSKINDTMVQNKGMLAKVAKELRLSEFIIKDESEEGHALTDGMLSDHMEALIGAVSMDGGFEKAEKLVLKFWTPVLDMALKSSTQVLANGPKQLEQKNNSVVALSGFTPVKQVQKPLVLNIQSQTLSAANPGSLSPRSQNLFTICPLTQYERYIREARDIDVSNSGKNGYTPLMTFLLHSENASTKAANKHLSIIEALCRAGASLDKPNKKGKTARQLIEDNPHKEVIKSRLGLK